MVVKHVAMLNFRRFFAQKGTLLVILSSNEEVLVHDYTMYQYYSEYHAGLLVAIS